MADKKKGSATRKNDRPAAHAAAAPAPAASAGAAAARPEGQAQRALFEAAMRLFHARELKEARDFFLRAMQGPERDVAQRAQLHAAMCDRRLDHAAPVLRTAEEYYNYGVALMNARDVGGARDHLAIALRLAPGSDHIHYALAVAQALAGDLAGGHENMRRAIELEPQNRIIARHDADLAPLAGRPPFDALLFPEKKGW